MAQIVIVGLRMGKQFALASMDLKDHHLPVGQSALLALIAHVTKLVAIRSALILVWVLVACQHSVLSLITILCADVSTSSLEIRLSNVHRPVRIMNFYFRNNIFVAANICRLISSRQCPLNFRQGTECTSEPLSAVTLWSKRSVPSNQQHALLFLSVRIYRNSAKL